MSPQQLIAHYERVAEAPNAISELRYFVLELANRGKLVAQQPEEEPGSILLQRLLARRKDLEEAGTIKKASLPYGPLPCGLGVQIPAAWARSTLGEVCDLQTGATPDTGRRDFFGGDVPWLVSGDINRGDISGCDGRITDLAVKMSNCKILPKGSVLIALNGQGKTRGTVALLCIPAACNQSLVALIPLRSDCLSPEYLRLNLKSRYRAIRRLTGGDERRGLNMRLISCFEIAIPPLLEQQRIVAKVDELMIMCDRLEAARTRREATRDRLTAGTLAPLNTPDSDPEVFKAHARFAIGAALPVVTTRPDQIRQLRRTILNLAVRGKLVPQDRFEEPASKLILRIRTYGPRDNRKRTCLEPLNDAELAKAPFALPAGWTWARFPELGQFGRGKSKHRPRNDPALFDGGTHRVVQTGDVARSAGVIRTFTGLYNDVGLAQSWKWPAGTLCITIAANIADSGILSFDACFPDSVVGFVPASDFENARYFEYFLRTAKANLLEFAPATAQKNINLEILNALLVPLPPLAEQHRIVATVDKLMSHCDNLEASMTHGEYTRGRLLNALLHDALAPVEPTSETA